MGSKVDIKIRRWEGVREWGNRWMLASPGPWRLGVAVALRSRSPQTAAELARSGSIRFYSIPNSGKDFDFERVTTYTY